MLLIERYPAPPGHVDHLERFDQTRITDPDRVSIGRVRVKEQSRTIQVFTDAVRSLTQRQYLVHIHTHLRVPSELEGEEQPTVFVVAPKGDVHAVQGRWTCPEQATMIAEHRAAVALVAERWLAVHEVSERIITWSLLEGGAHVQAQFDVVIHEVEPHLMWHIDRRVASVEQEAYVHEVIAIQFDVRRIVSERLVQAEREVHVVHDRTGRYDSCCQLGLKGGSKAQKGDGK